MSRSSAPFDKLQTNTHALLKGLLTIFSIFHNRRVTCYHENLVMHQRKIPVKLKYRIEKSPLNGRELYSWLLLKKRKMVPLDPNSVTGGIEKKYISVFFLIYFKYSEFYNKCVDVDHCTTGGQWHVHLDYLEGIQTNFGTKFSIFIRDFFFF